MASRRQGQAIAPQRIDYAFTPLGWALKIPVDQTKNYQQPIIINAYEPSSTPWENAATKILAAGVSSPWRNSLAFHPWEVGLKEENGIHRYLLVGFTFPNLDDKYDKLHDSQKKQAPVGVQLNEDAIISRKEIPVMVVAQILNDEPAKQLLYALLQDKSGLCKPYQIGQSKCFYLPIYRDETTDKKLRGKNWNQLVMKQAVQAPIQASSRIFSSKQIAHEKAQNTSKINLDTKVSLQNEISCLIACFAETKDMWHLKELEALLEQADPDLAFKPASNTAMHQFVDNEEEFEDGDAIAMIEELRQIWPDLEEIDPSDLKILKEQLVEEDIVLKYRLIRPFVAEGCFKLREARQAKPEAEGGISNDIPSVAKSVVASASRMFGNSGSDIPIMISRDESRLLSAVRSALEDMLKNSRAFEKALKDSCGDQTMTGTLHDIWEKYATALDTDAAKKAWFEAVRYLIAAQRHKERGLGQMIEDLVGILRNVKFEDDNEA